MAFGFFKNSGKPNHRPQGGSPNLFTGPLTRNKQTATVNHQLPS